MTATSIRVTGGAGGVGKLVSDKAAAMVAPLTCVDIDGDATVVAALA